jgi:hypothetical protein
VEVSNDGSGAVRIAFPLGLRRCLYIRPFGLERLQNRRDDQPLDIRAGRIMRAEFFALGGIQRLFKQRAENGGLDEFPILRRGLV